MGHDVGLKEKPVDRELLERVVRALYETPEHRPMDAAKRLDMTKVQYISLLARAALEGVYDAYGMVATTPIKNKLEIEPRPVFERIAETGNLLGVAKEFGVSQRTLQRWIRPVEMAYRGENLNRNATLQSPAVMDSLTENVLRELAREDQIQASLAGKRWKLADQLYDEARYHWNRAHELAGDNPVPAAALRAVVEAAHNAVKDAQLLSGQATDRVEGFLKDLTAMSDEELRAFITEPVEPREYNTREDARVKVEDGDTRD